MNKITMEMTERGYEYAKRVYYETISKKNALDELAKETGMNRGSASDYIQGLKYMLTGRGYKRTFNSEATDYFLENIFEDFGGSYLGLALQAVRSHIDYYSELRKVNLYSIEQIYNKHKKKLESLRVDGTLNGDELDDSKNYLEGQKKLILVNAYERNVEARRKCISHYGTSCQVCGLNFGKLYGELGEGFIHVHHLKLISTIGEQYKVDAINDLKPVCPNCHAMLHRKNPPLTIAELKEFMFKQI